MICKAKDIIRYKTVSGLRGWVKNDHLCQDIHIGSNQPREEKLYSVSDIEASDFIPIIPF